MQSPLNCVQPLKMAGLPLGLEKNRIGMVLCSNIIMVVAWKGDIGFNIDMLYDRHYLQLIYSNLSPETTVCG